jgi:dTDP-glucose 4,6-dehydratase
MSLRILVTGGAGFIGSNLVRHLLKQPEVEKVINLDALTYAGNAVSLEGVASDGRYLFQEGRIQDRTLVSQLLKEHAITHVMNLAAESHVDRSIEGPDAFIQTNIVGTFEMYWKHATVLRKRSTTQSGSCMFPPTRYLVVWEMKVSLRN